MLVNNNQAPFIEVTNAAKKLKPSSDDWTSNNDQSDDLMAYLDNALWESPSPLEVEAMLGVDAAAVSEGEENPMDLWSLDDINYMLEGDFAVEGGMNVISLGSQLNNFENVEKMLKDRLGDAETKRIISRAVYLIHIGRLPDKDETCSFTGFQKFEHITRDGENRQESKRKLRLEREEGLRLREWTPAVGGASRAEDKSLALKRKRQELVKPVCIRYSNWTRGFQVEEIFERR
ncbi:hypothetical protein F2Q70_00037354 [Brassica cretica]|uniref:Uncharacterized protein n=1 Tax=Brassica cretica TaxID=69181 RepID=A0A8S9JRS2_BRACR|nr:hypothetical protein F2Q70_00037354 [Brassica cretica]